MDNNFDIYGKKRSHTRMIGRCAQCGFAIYSDTGAFSVKESGEMLHEYCLADFFDEHMFDYVEKLDREEE